MNFLEIQFIWRGGGGRSKELIYFLMVPISNQIRKISLEFLKLFFEIGSVVPEITSTNKQTHKRCFFIILVGEKGPYVNMGQM